MQSIHYWPPEERDRVEFLISEIVRFLRRHPRAEQFEAPVRPGVEMAAVCMMQASGSQQIQKDSPQAPSAPREIEKRLTKIQKLSKDLLDELKDSPLQLDVLLFGENRVILSDNAIVKDVEGRIVSCGDYEKEWGGKDRFTQQLRRLTSVEYEAPHHRSDFVKDLSAEIALNLMLEHSTSEPSSTENGTLRDIAAYLYEIANPSRDGEIHDLKRACDKVMKKYRQSVPHQ
jgi:hypothetical protein